MAQRSLHKRLWYRFLQIFFRALGAVLFSVRCEGRQRIPRQGGVLILSNHQSHFDPVLIGLACDRRLNALARETLFRFKPFGWLISTIDAIPIDREGLGISGLKETLRRLKREEIVLIFPEGTRTHDGNVAPLKPGFSALVKRARVPLVPVGIAGAYDAWPRWRMLPRLGAIQVEFGAPILPAEIESSSDRDLVAEVQRRIEACHAEAKRRHSRRCRYDRIGTPADDRG